MERSISICNLLILYVLRFCEMINTRRTVLCLVMMVGSLLCFSGISSAVDITEGGRFVVNGDGTVTDNKTGLMWSNSDNGKDINWDDAKVYCDSFDAGGFKDWHLPDQRELSTIFDPTSKARYKSFEAITLSACCPWTSNTRRSQAKSLFFMMGERNWYSKSSSSGFRALPVRKAR